MKNIIFIAASIFLFSCEKDNIYPEGYPGGASTIDSNVTAIPGESGKAFLSKDTTINGNYSGDPSSAYKVLAFDNFSIGDAVNNGHFSSYSYHADQDINVNIKSRLYISSETGRFVCYISKNGTTIESSVNYQEKGEAFEGAVDLRAWNQALKSGDSITVYFRSFGNTTIRQQDSGQYSNLEVIAY
jgi:hypothetical protein